MGNMIEKFQLIGAFVELNENTIHIKMEKNIEPVDVITEPFPGFSYRHASTIYTNQFYCKWKCHCEDTIEKIFENRFMHVQELVRMYRAAQSLCQKKYHQLNRFLRSCQ